MDTHVGCALSFDVDAGTELLLQIAPTVVASEELTLSIGEVRELPGAHGCLLYTSDAADE